MLIGYARISKADGSQSLDLQRDALREAGVSDDAIYEDQASGQREDRPGLAAFLKAARQGDVIVVWLSENDDSPSEAVMAKELFCSSPSPTS